MAGDEPTAKRRSERVGLGLQPCSQSIREGTNRRGNQLPVGGKGQIPQGRRAQPAPYRRCENATQTQNAEGVFVHARTGKLPNRGVHLWPRVEDTYREPQCCPLVHWVVHLFPGVTPLLNRPRATAGPTATH